MRVAIFSDIHGNTTALEAVLADIERDGGVDAFWVLGDFAVLGPDPVGAVRQVAALPNLTAVYGNTDRYALTEDIGSIPQLATRIAEAEHDPDVRARLNPILQAVAWARSELVASGELTWLANLPLEARAELPDGTRVLLVHASPGTDDGAGLREAQSDEVFAAQLAGAGADLVIVGHTHFPIDRESDGVRVHNLGSVSVHYTDDRRAMWTLLEAGASGYTLERRFAEYDHAAMLAALDDVDHPAKTFIRSLWG